MRHPSTNINQDYQMNFNNLIFNVEKEIELKKKHESYVTAKNVRIPLKID